MSSLTRRVVVLLVFGSGFCALIYQTTWLREFRLIFGASTAATAAVLGVFMAGLGFGGIILGRRSEIKARPLAFYAKLELLIAGSAAVTPLLVWAARYLYIALGGTSAMGMSLGTVARLLFASAIIGTPTFLMGGTLPAAARAVVAPDDIPRRAVGVLYGVNTLGAVVGATAGTFYFFENFGNRATLWLAAALNVVVALIAFYFSTSTSAQSSARKLSCTGDEEKPSASPIFVLIAAALVGFAFFLMELVWYRMLSPLFGSTTYCFGLILAVALLGIGTGGAAYAFLGLKRLASVNLFALTCAAEAFFLALPYALGDRIAMAAMLLRPLGTVGFHGHVIAWLALCSIVVLPAALIAGVQFPLLIALLGRGRERVGAQTGAAYAWNTTGALFGSLAGGFGFMPIFSAPGVWKIATILLCGLAIIAACLAARESRHWSRAIPPFLIVTVALAMLRATGPTAFWRHSQIGVGRVKQFQGSPNQMRDLVQKIRRKIMWEKDGIESSVALSNEDGLSFIINGRNDGNAKTDAAMQVMFGLIGAALHPHPAKAMVIGLGTGSTAGWLAAVPSIQRVDVIELEPAILKVAERCAPVNHNALANPKLHVIIGDAREWLLTNHEKYDLIASEPSNPYRAGIAGLFTREFYESVKQRLAPGGMLLQWVQAYEVDDYTMEIIYHTLGSVFENIESWQPQDGDLVLAASREPVHYDVEALRSRLAEEPFKSALPAVWRENGLEDFLGHYVANGTVAKTLERLGSGALNTDDRTVIEFAFARSVDLLNGFRIATVLAGARAGQADRPQFIDGAIDWHRVDEARMSFVSLDQSPEMQSTMTPEQRTRAGAFLAYTNGDLTGALRQWRAQFDEPKTLSQLALVAEGLASEGKSEAMPYIEQLAEVLPTDAEMIRAKLFFKQNRIEEATQSLDKFLHALRDDPWPDSKLIERGLALVEGVADADKSKLAAVFLYNALRAPFCVFNKESDRLEKLVKIGMALDGKDPGQYTLAGLEAFEPHVPWLYKFLQVRKICYAAVHSPRAEQASRDFDEFVKREPTKLDAAALIKAMEARSSEKPVTGRTKTSEP
jgi:spermidine synthase